MANLFVTMKVKDFDHWYQGFKGHVDVRSQWCDESRTKVYQTPEDHNGISITLYDVDMEALQKMISSPEFQAMAEELGEISDTKRIHSFSEMGEG